jgi:putative spermidine/putrescine transport system ATP-binding protein
MNNNNTPSVHLENATFSYPGGKAGVFDITLDIAPGELIVCIGPSGCGKTTLLKLIAGFLPCTAGRVHLGGEDVTAASVRSRQCGIVFQSYALFPHMSVWENVAYPLRVRDIALNERRRRADAMLDMVGLGGFGARLPAELSGGQQQRVAVARALITRPAVLFADEPTGNLDSRTGGEVLDLLRHSVDKFGQTVIMVTHDAGAASIADRIVFLKDGRIVLDRERMTRDAIYDTIKNLERAPVTTERSAR